MHIHDFHSKLTSTTEGGPLFEALRSLSGIEDLKTVLNVDPIISGEWPQWPSMDPHSSDATSKGA
jgi:hypothetical protein